MRLMACATALIVGFTASACAREQSRELRRDLAGAASGREGGPDAPASLDAFRAEVQKVLDETGVPGAGIALVRQAGVEWAGGVGLADRGRRTPVTADTHFRVGSISKTFVAMGLVQLSEDGEFDIDATVASIAPEVEIDNPWDRTDPVRVIHLLQHTAGLDDMHFNEVYNRAGPADLPLQEVLALNPASRRVRWRPGTRMAYSNPGYGVAGYLLEQVSGEKYEHFIKRRIFDPTGMPTSSFVLGPEDEAVLARGYTRRDGPPVPFSQIYLRPAGNLHTSPAELGRFVRMLLNWGESRDELVIDPEYLSNMELPRTTLASRAGLRAGYGSGISHALEGPFPWLGHGGGIDGFISTYAYSPARDVGYVVLLNATYSGDALRRIAALAAAYLKADVEPPARPEVQLAAERLRMYEGYYHDASPRNQALAFVEWLLSGLTVVAGNGRLQLDPAMGPPVPLVAVSDTLFRRESDVNATSVFTPDAEGNMVYTGASVYAERVPRWRVEVVRVPVLASAALLLTTFLVAVAWLAHARRASPRGFWWLKAAQLLCAAGLVLPYAGIMGVNDVELGALNAWTLAMFVGTMLLPGAAPLAAFFTIDAWRHGAGPWLRAYGLAVSLAAFIVSAYLASWGMIGFRTWAF